MNGIERAVLDTNILIYYLQGDENVRKYFEDIFPIISFINELEVLSGAHFFPDELVEIRKFLQQQYIIDYSSDKRNCYSAARYQEVKVTGCHHCSNGYFL